MRIGMGNRIRWRLFRTCLCKWKLFVGVLAERHKCFSSVDSQRIAMMQRALSWHKDVICHGGGPCSRRLPPSPPPPLCLIALSLPCLPISACRPSSTRATTPARTCTQSPFHTLFPAHHGLGQSVRPVCRWAYDDGGRVKCARAV